MSEKSAMEFEEEEGEEDTADKVKKGKTKTRRKLDDDVVSSSYKKTVKGIMLSVCKPSYTLKGGIGPDVRSLHWEHRNKLRYLLQQLVRRQNWDEASGVLSVLLKGTFREISSSKNRTKYWVTMELLQHIRDANMKPRKIQHVYEIWMKKNVTVRNQSSKDRFVVQLEYIMFSLAHGDIDGAYQAVISLMQERGFGSDPISNLVVGLAFCHIWYTGIRKELELKDSHESYSPIQSETLGFRCDMSIDKSNGHDVVEVHEADSPLRRDSDTSIRIDKEISPEVVDQIREVPMEVDANPQRVVPYHERSDVNTVRRDESEKSSSSTHSGNAPYASVFYAHALEPWLMPLKFPPRNQLEDFISLQERIHNDHYKAAVKHLQSALHSTPPAFEALLPLIQMLLLGDQVKEAVNEVEKVTQISDAVLPLRLKATLMEHFCPNNYAELWTFFENTLKRDPTCSHSLARLISIHRDGYYSAEKLLEMLATHLDATYANFDIWEEFASCFLKLSQCDEDRMSRCNDGDGGGCEQNYTSHFNRNTEMFTNGIMRKNWRLRCRWWLTRHFSSTILASEFASGNLELLTYKAVSASHFYGPKFEYVVKASVYLKEQNREMYSILKMHMKQSIGFYLDFHKKSH